MKKIAFLVMALTLISKFTGFFREVVLGYFYGATDISDAYNISITIPRTIFRFAGSALKAAFIPLYIRIQKEHGEGHANRFTNNILNIVFLFATLIVIVTLLFPEQVVFVFASGFEGEVLDTTVTFIRITVFSLYFVSFVSVFKPFLHTKDNYTIPAIIGLPMNIMIIAGIAISSQFDPVYMAVGYLIAMLSQAVLMLPFVLKNKFFYRFQLEIKDKHVKMFFLMIVPILISVGVADINKIVAQNIASNIGEGAVSAMNYAKRLNGFIQGIIFLGITTAMFPLISRMASKQDIKGLKKTLRESVNLAVILVLPASIGALLFAREIVSLVFERGAFDERAVAMTTSALFFFAFGFLAKGLKQVFKRAFFSLGDTKTPLVNAIITITVVTSLSLLSYFFTDLGVGGLALAQSLSAIVTALFLMYLLRRKIGRLGYKNMLTVFIKVLIASIIMGIVARVAYYYATIHVPLPQDLLTIGAIALGAGVYGGLIFFMRIEDVDILVDTFKSKFKKIFGKNGADGEVDEEETPYDSIDFDE